MKKLLPVFMVMVVLLALVKWYHTAQPAVEPVLTDIGIFIDYFDISTSKAIRTDALKAIDSDSSHLFCNKQLWLACATCVDQKLFMEQWLVYDTGIGLLYIKNKEASDKIALRLNIFTLINDPFDQQAIECLKDNKQWAHSFEKLFDLALCAKNHAHKDSRIVVYMNGHGMWRTDDVSTDLVCGMNALEFAHLLTFFNDKLHIDFLGVQSCYWTTERIYQLLGHVGYNTVDFAIITPLSTEEPVWLDDLCHYLHQDDRFSFFDCCFDVVSTGKEQQIDEIKSLVYATDTLKLKENGQQKASLLPAGSSQVQLI